MTLINGKDVRTLSDESLAYHRSDLQEVIESQDDMVRNGMNCPKLPQYEEERAAVLAEIKRRANGGIQMPTEREKKLLNVIQTMLALIPSHRRAEAEQVVKAELAEL